MGNCGWESFGLSGSVTIGVISALSREQNQISDFTNLIQTDAAINPGNSGGALLNIDGELIGINTAILSKTGGFMGISFAIPSNVVKHIQSELISKGNVERGWIGAQVAPVTDRVKRNLNLDSKMGALIRFIYPNSPAEKIKLRKGDVITKFNNEPINSSLKLNYLLSVAPIQTSLPIEFIRKSKRYQETIVIEKPTFKQGPKLSYNHNLKITVTSITPDMIRSKKAPDFRGVIIKSLDPDSPLIQKGVDEVTL